jgi:AraC-like DNA-binding protein
MQLVHLAPCPALAPFVDSFWHAAGELPHRHERILPSATLQLLINLDEDELRSWHGEGYGTLQRTRGAVLCGVPAGHFAIDTAEQRAIMGIAFKPGGAAPFLAMPVAETFGLDVELDALWGRDGGVLRERLLAQPTPEARLQTLQAALLALFTRPPALDPAIAFALRALDRGLPVHAIARRLELSPTRLGRRFAAKVGVTPKRYGRLQRFQRLLRAIEPDRPVDWADLAAGLRYADQAHLIHEFRAFAGISPTAYRPRAVGDRNHMPLLERDFLQSGPPTAR